MKARLLPEFVRTADGKRENIITLYIDGTLIVSIDDDGIEDVRRPGEHLRFQWGKWVPRKSD